jgi:pyridoxamine 5'-phosphate oxidase
MAQDPPPDDPLELFRVWYGEAETAEPNDPNAMALATVGADGMPSVRMVLLKDWGPDGFVFYTNLESRKGVQLRQTPKAALVIHWKSLGRQVRVEGDVTPVSEAEADAYFASRSRGSQIGAWASSQSKFMANPHDLEKRVAQYTAKFNIGKVPRPEYWSGFRIAPTRIEFWREGRFRLHQRFLYCPDGTGGWSIQRLYP